MRMGIPMNDTVGAGSSISLVVPCYNILFVPQSVESYELTVNYTLGGRFNTANGILNITTAGFP